MGGGRKGEREGGSRVKRGILTAKAKQTPAKEKTIGHTPQQKDMTDTMMATMRTPDPRAPVTITVC